MRITRIGMTFVAVGMAAALGGAWRTKPLAADSENRIAMRDDCDPRDPAWAPTGGCALEEGDVDNAEFRQELSSTLAPTSVIGHQAWRMDPSYLKIETDHEITVTNRGGRTHTFTEVKEFGGGKIPPPGAGLNKGLITAPECPASTNVPPGATVEVDNLTPGNHKFQCCIHPWMRVIVKVKPEDEN